MITTINQFKKSLNENFFKRIRDFFKHPCPKCGNEMWEEPLTNEETFYRCPNCDKHWSEKHKKTVKTKDDRE